MKIVDLQLVSAYATFIFRINCLMAGPRGKGWKRIFNFKASFGVLNPLATPIKMTV